jgi:type IVB pilus formation R64 PilN family outer membrane protein
MMVRGALGLILCLCVSACGLPPGAKDRSDAKLAEAKEALARAGATGSAMPSGPVVMHEGIWVGNRSIAHANGEPLPSATLLKGAVVLNSMGVPLELREICTEISAQTGLQVSLEDRQDVTPGTNAATSAAPHLPAGMPLAWNGPLPGLLDGVATFFGVQWEYRGGQLRIFRNEIRTFTLAALPSNSTIRAAVNTTGGGAEGGGGTSTSTTSGAAASGVTAATGSMLQDTANETTLKFWDDVKEAVQVMLPTGGKVAMSPATGTLTVMAPPGAMNRIAAYVEQQNARITRQVTIAVKVLRVDVNDGFDLGLDLGVVFQQMAGRYGLALSGPAPPQVSAGTPASYVVQALSGAKQWINGSGTANATHAVIDALETMGHVSLTTESSVTTLNGQAAPVSVVEQQSYVASTATTLAGGVTGTVQTQITPGTLITGFNMQVLPRILDDGEVLLQYGMSLSDLKALTTFGQTGSQVQLPDVNLRSFLQQVLMRSGDLLVLAGYQSLSDSQNNSGLPFLGPSPLGGGVQSAQGKSLVVIMITPEILPRFFEARGAM